MRWIIFIIMAVLGTNSNDVWANSRSGTSRELSLQGKVKKYTLDNGLRVLIMERHTSPTIAVRLFFLSGSVDEPDDKTGLAHLIEHMMFKGTKTIGTKDYKSELPLLLTTDSLANEILTEKVKSNPDSLKLNSLISKFDSVYVLSKEYIEQRGMDNIYSKQGGVGVNAGTSKDFTMYMVDLPSNKLELWARITADIVENTIFRGFYDEKNVIMNELRMYEDEPNSKFYQEFMKNAFKVHPYGKPITGEVEDITGLTVNDLKAFCKLHYVPANAIIGIVGDVNSEEAKAIIDKYFSHLSKRKLPPKTIKAEPPQTAERRIEVELDAEPMIFIGYHIPTFPDFDAYVLDVLSSVLSDGRTARLYKKMVDEKIASGAYTGSGTPGQRYPNLFIFSGAPILPHTTAEIESCFYDEIEKLKKEPVDESELKKIRNQVKAGFLRSLQDNGGIAMQLIFYESLGDWRKLLEYVEIIDKITSKDIMRVANKYFTKENRTVAMLVKKAGGKSLLELSMEYYEQKTGKSASENIKGKLKEAVDQIETLEKTYGTSIPREQKLQAIYGAIDMLIKQEEK